MPCDAVAHFAEPGEVRKKPLLEDRGNRIVEISRFREIPKFFNDLRRVRCRYEEVWHQTKAALDLTLKGSQPGRRGNHSSRTFCGSCCLELPLRPDSPAILTPIQLISWIALIHQAGAAGSCGRFRCPCWRLAFPPCFLAPVIDLLAGDGHICPMQSKLPYDPHALRLWLACNETAYYAAWTIGMRSMQLAAAFWLRGSIPVSELARMVSEKQMAAAESILAVGFLALARPIVPVKISAAALRPYRRRTKANFNRLRRRHR